MQLPNDFVPNSEFASPQFESLCAELERLSGDLESDGSWPAAQFERLADAGVLGWVIPAEFGGSEVSAEDLTFGYQRMAACCLSTTFVLTQRNGACQRIADSQNADLKSEFLPQLCAGGLFATVGISHLTTSRQHLRKPAVEARQTRNGFVLKGTVPWVTGAAHADYIVTGGTCEDGKQILVALPRTLEGVVIHQPPQLLALNSSQTGSVVLDDVAIKQRFLIAGPVEQVMKRGKGGGDGSLTTSALALGVTAGVLKRLQSESEQRPDLVEIHESLEAERAAVSADMYRMLAAVSPDAEAGLNAESIRQRANSLVLRSSEAYLAASKGAGFTSGHPAERAVREAMFFLVWSCPQPVLTAALREFACVVNG